MRAHRTHRVDGRRTIPRLEALEDRCVPAGTVTFGAGTLTIQGDGTPNVVTINDVGSGDIGTVSVTLDGVTTSNTAVITALTINADTLNGADVVRYNLTSNLAAVQSRTLNVNLGDKNDFFQASTATAVQGANLNGSLAFNVNGQKGRDRLFFDFSKDVDILGAGAALIINASGGLDRDTIALAFEGQVNGTLTFNLNGNQDRDRISAYAAIDDNSSGTTTGSVRGQGGDDLLALVVNISISVTGSATGTLDGGAGSDVGIASLFVSTSGVENLFKLPF